MESKDLTKGNESIRQEQKEKITGVDLRIENREKKTWLWKVWQPKGHFEGRRGGR